MQNKANLPDAQMNVNKALTKDYENRTLGERGKNKANSKPNKANFQKAQMNVNKVLTRDYENKSNWALCENKANSNPIKANFQKAQIFVTTFLIKEYENISNWAICENKPNTNPTCRGVASGEAGSNPTCRGVASGEAGSNPTCHRPSAHERDEKNRSRRPLIDPICPWRKSDCIKQVPVLGERSDNKGHLLALEMLKKLVVDKCVKIRDNLSAVMKIEILFLIRKMYQSPWKKKLMSK
jgi:hypothetical protein